MAFACEGRVAPDPRGQVVLALAVAGQEDGPAVTVVEVHLVQRVERVDDRVGAKLFVGLVVVATVVAPTGHAELFQSTGRPQRVSDEPIVISTIVFANFTHYVFWETALSRCLRDSQLKTDHSISESGLKEYFVLTSWSSARSADFKDLKLEIVFK